MKQWLSRVLAAVLVSVCLLAAVLTGAGCGGVDPDISGGTEEYVELDWFTGYPLGITPPDLDMVLDAFNEKLKEKLNCKVNFYFTDWLGYDSKLSLKINALDQFDICFTGTMFNDYFANVEKEAFFDLTDYLDTYAPAIMGKLEQRYKDIVKVDGRSYGFVNRQVAARQFCAVFGEQSFADYTAHAAEYGNKNPAKSLDEITELADVTDFLAFCADKYDTRQVTSTFDMDGIYYYWGFDTFGNWKMPGVVRYDDQTCKVINQFDTPEWRDAMTLGRSWFKKDYYWPNMSTATPNYSKFHMRFAPTYKPGMETEEYSVMQQKTVSARLGKQIIFTGGPLSAMNAVSATSPNPVRALQVLNLLYEDKELYNMLVFGLEGTHYDVLETFDNGLKRVRRKNVDRYSMPIAWALGDQFNQYIEEGQDADVWDQTKTFDDSATVSSTFGFVFDSSRVKTEVANCTSLINNYWYSLMVGLGKDDEWLEKTYADFLSKLEKAGCDRIIAEKQRQINEWLQSKGA